MDLNHRKLLGTLSSLWSITLPYISKMKIVIFSLDSLRGLAQIEGFSIPDENTPENDPSWTLLMQNLHKKLKGPRVACCFKSRDKLIKKLLKNL